MPVLSAGFPEFSLLAKYLVSVQLPEPSIKLTRPDVFGFLVKRGSGTLDCSTKLPGFSSDFDWGIYAAWAFVIPEGELSVVRSVTLSGSITSEYLYLIRS